jgi:hypothetical protein
MGERECSTAPRSGNRVGSLRPHAARGIITRLNTARIHGLRHGVFRHVTAQRLMLTACKGRVITSQPLKPTQGCPVRVGRHTPSRPYS